MVERISGKIGFEPGVMQVVLMMNWHVWKLKYQYLQSRCIISTSTYAICSVTLDAPTTILSYQA